MKKYLKKRKQICWPNWGHPKDQVCWWMTSKMSISYLPFFLKSVGKSSVTIVVKKKNKIKVDNLKTINPSLILQSQLFLRTLSLIPKMVIMTLLDRSKSCTTVAKYLSSRIKTHRFPLIYRQQQLI